MKNKIINLEIKPGEKIDKKSISKELKMSATPIKQALTKLEDEEFVKISPRKSYTVTDINLKLIKDIFQARLRIEPILIELTLNHCDENTLKTAFNNFKKAFINFNVKKNQNGDDFDNLYDQFKVFFSENCGNKFFKIQAEIIYSHLTRIRKFLYGPKNRRLEAVEEHIAIIEKILNNEPIEDIKLLTYIHIQKAQSDFFKNLENLKI